MSAGRSSLVFRRLDVRRTPGILSPYSIDEISAGINITYGPNASGKSTTAQALQMLLWNDVPGWSRASLAGRLDVDGSEWRIEIDAGEVETRRDGTGDARLPIETANHRDRYVLTLHDLLRADDADFASIILRESAGGYDIDAARTALGYRDTPPRPRNDIRDLELAQQRTREARQAERELMREQQNLDRLKVQLDGARSAVADVAILEKALVAKQRARDLEVARETLETLPENISRLRGDELDRLAELRERAIDYDQRRRQAEAEIRKAESEVDDARLNDADLPPGFIAELRTRGQQLRDQTARVREAESEVEDRAQQRASAARQLSRQIDESRMRELEVDGLRELVALSRRHQQARMECESAEELRGWLGDIQRHDDIERLRHGISLLNAWLRSGGSPTASSVGTARWILPSIVGGGLIGLIVLVAAVAGHPLFLLGLILAPLPLLVSLLLRPKPVSGRASYARDEYTRLGLEQPRSWRVDQVELLVDHLGQEWRRQLLEQEKAQRWANLETRWRQTTATFQELDAEWRTALDKYSLEPLDPSELFLISQHLDRWQAADSQFDSAWQRARRERTTLDEILSSVNRDLELAGYETSSDQVAVLGQIEDFAGRMDRINSARQRIESSRSTLEQIIRPEIERLEREQRELFSAVGLEPGDERTLADWIDRRGDYLDAQESVQESEVALRNAMSDLGDHGSQLDRSRADLEAGLRSAQLRAEEAEQLHRVIIEIETRIEAAKQARNLEEAIVDEEYARDVLRDDREEGYRLAAGWMLSEFVRQQTRDRDRPRVFHRARELFVRMTQGRYTLQFSDNPSPAFHATDTTTNMTHNLDELSSATRVQLLMAVRMAFVEEMEHGPKLPLLLDETLGNADEHRAEAIIRSVCEICRDGRQVFYFTAQLDEVSKWRRLLREYDGLPHHVISLVESRHLPEYERSVLEDLQPTRPSVPAPDGSSHAEYRDVLHVPEINPQLDADAVHLWYLVHAPGQLHRLLSLGISTWGQLRTLVEFGGDDLMSPDVFSAALARSKVVGAALQARRIGRGRRVDRAAVLDSEAFTPAFVERVIRQAEQVDGDAERLLERLENGRVSRLRNNYIDAFRTYLTDEGYLDSEDPLTAGEIRARVLGEATKDIVAGIITTDDVDMLLHCMPPLPE